MEVLHGIARMSVEWMVYCLTEGIVLSLFAWVLLRLLPRQNAGTRFALWFSVLIAIAGLPCLAGRFFTSPATGLSQKIASGHSLLTISDSLALGIWAAWAVIAVVGLLRVVAGFWQVNRIRQNSEELDPQKLSLELQATLKGFRRKVTLRVSDSVQVPAAVGFLHPAVVIPRWFLEEISPAELQQVVLHELTHLRRRDDWTNLLQKIIKSLLFFHPFVWWVEQRLSLEREMACDEAVLAQAGSPHGYAQCLARLAERSFVRRKLALAQAAVSRMRQLSLRMVQILDVNRPSSTRIWKPAVPMVLAAATLCGFSAWSAPTLVSFHDDTAQPAIHQAQAAHDASIGENGAMQPKVILASATLDQGQGVPVRPAPAKHRPVSKTARAQARFNSDSKAKLTRYEMAMAVAHQAALSNISYVMHTEQMIVTTADDAGTGQPQTWHVSMWQMNIVVLPSDEASKTVPRKKI